MHEYLPIISSIKYSMGGGQSSSQVKQHAQSDKQLSIHMDKYSTSIASFTQKDGYFRIQFDWTVPKDILEQLGKDVLQKYPQIKKIIISHPQKESTCSLCGKEHIRCLGGLIGFVIEIILPAIKEVMIGIGLTTLRHMLDWLTEKYRAWRENENPPEQPREAPPDQPGVVQTSYPARAQISPTRQVVLNQIRDIKRKLAEFQVQINQTL